MWEKESKETILIEAGEEISKIERFLTTAQGGRKEYLDAKLKDAQAHKEYLNEQTEEWFLTASGSDLSGWFK